MNCTSIRPLLEPLAAGELVDREAATAREHLGGCESCSAESVSISELHDLLQTGLTAADRAALRTPAPSRRWTWMIPLGAAAAVLVGVVVMVMRPSGTQVLHHDDGSTFEVRAGSNVEQVESGVKLYSGHLKATFASSSRSRVLLPAGEVRGGEGGGAVSVDVEPQGGTEMQPATIVLTVLCLSGSVRLGGGETLLPGNPVRREITLRQDKPRPVQDLEKFVADYRKALLDGDDKKCGELFDLIVGKEREAIGIVRGVWKGWDGSNGARYEELKKRNTQLKKDIMDGGDEKALYELYKKDLEALAALERERTGLVGLVAELQLRESWSKNAPVLDTVVHAIRSFEHFARKSDWANAAKCLQSGKEQEAKDLHKVSVVVWEGWKEKQTWSAEESWNTQSETKVTVFGYYNGFDASGPGVTFPGARGVATFSSEKDGTVRIWTIVKGDHIE